MIPDGIFILRIGAGGVGDSSLAVINGFDLSVADGVLAVFDAAYVMLIILYGVAEFHGFGEFGAGGIVNILNFFAAAKVYERGFVEVIVGNRDSFGRIVGDIAIGVVSVVAAGDIVVFVSVATDRGRRDIGNIAQAVGACGITIREVVKQALFSCQFTSRLNLI